MRLGDALHILNRARSMEASVFPVYLACGFEPLHVATFLQAYMQQARPGRLVEIRTGLYGDLAGNLERNESRDAEAVAILVEWPDIDPRLGLRNATVWSPRVEAEIAADAPPRVVFPSRAASKNDPEVVEQAFPIEAHWGPKSESVGRIASAWNIGLDGIVFVDDSALELAEVKRAHPAVECLDFPADPANLPRLLARLRDCFGREHVSQEDHLRMQSVRRNRGWRERLQESGTGDAAIPPSGPAIWSLRRSSPCSLLTRAVSVRWVRSPCLLQPGKAKPRMSTPG